MRWEGAIGDWELEAVAQRREWQAEQCEAVRQREVTSEAKKVAVKVVGNYWKPGLMAVLDRCSGKGRFQEQRRSRVETARQFQVMDERIRQVTKKCGFGKGDEEGRK